MEKSHQNDDFEANSIKWGGVDMMPKATAPKVRTKNTIILIINFSEKFRLTQIVKYLMDSERWVICGWGGATFRRSLKFGPFVSLKARATRGDDVELN